MDIMGLSRRLFDQIGQTANAATEAVKKTAPVETKESPDTIQETTVLTERLHELAEQYDVKSLAVSDLIPLQEDLKQQGFIGSEQVRAQALLPQLAYHHYEAGPMDVESALQDHLQRLQDKPAVLADFQDSKHLLNVIRNLSSARQQISSAA